MKEFQLTPKDKEILLNWGYPQHELQQIEDAANMGEYTTKKGRKIKLTTAIRMLGKECFLSGIAWAAFHWSASRENEKNTNKGVYIDCSNYFK